MVALHLDRALIRTLDKVMIVQPRDRVPAAERPQAALRLFLRDSVDTAWYLSEYPDVAVGELGALEHYERYGRAERRHPNRAARRSAALTHLVDNEWYLSRYVDVAAAAMDPAEHYESFGRDEGRFANALVEKRGGFAEMFDREWYLNRYRDVAQAGAEAGLHYVRYGHAEGRHSNPLAEERSSQLNSEVYDLLRSKYHSTNNQIRDYFEFRTYLGLYRLGYDPYDLLLALDHYDSRTTTN